jgi:hypothetical protein
MCTYNEILKLNQQLIDKGGFKKNSNEKLNIGLIGFYPL